MPNRICVSGIARFCLVSADANGLAAFYEKAFDARIVSRERGEASTSIMLAIGAQHVELLSFDRCGHSYPAESDASDIAFQHFAIVVSDMDAVYSRLQAILGWRPISREGPQQLPARSGGVVAFKFRDPEGHPLELLQFPSHNRPLPWRSASSNPVLGIDHTAISVADTDKSVAFYESLGLSVTARNVNHGSEQDRLDGLSDVTVDVTALCAPDATPHVELLCYRDHSMHSAVADNDVAATRIVFRSADSRGESLVDPDGHRVIVLPGDD